MNDTQQHPNSQWFVTTTMNALGMTPAEFAHKTRMEKSVIDGLLKGERPALDSAIGRICKAVRIEFHLAKYLCSEIGSGMKPEYAGLRETIKEAYQKSLRRRFSKEPVSANM